MMSVGIIVFLSKTTIKLGDFTLRKIVAVLVMSLGFILTISGTVIGATIGLFMLVAGFIVFISKQTIKFGDFTLRKIVAVLVMSLGFILSLSGTVIGAVIGLFMMIAGFIIFIARRTASSVISRRLTHILQTWVKWSSRAFLSMALYNILMILSVISVCV